MNVLLVVRHTQHDGLRCTKFFMKFYVYSQNNWMCYRLMKIANFICWNHEREIKIQSHILPYYVVFCFLKTIRPECKEKKKNPQKTRKWRNGKPHGDVQ